MFIHLVSIFMVLQNIYHLGMLHKIDEKSQVHFKKSTN